MKHICYKSRKQLVSIYGESIGNILHKVIVNRRERNRISGVVENWFSFSLYPESGHLLLASFCK